MPDREKVIKVLEYCVLSDDCRPCEYCMEFDDTGCQIMKDALELLKEQEAVERTCRKGINGFSIIWTCGACGSDLHPNNAKAKYCSNCGQAVKWEE